MHLVDNEGELAPYLTDLSRKIPKSHLKAVCKKIAGQPVKTEQCRYVAIMPHGCWCVKHSPIKVTLDAIVARSKGGARGDNCPGFDSQIGVPKDASSSDGR